MKCLIGLKCYADYNDPEAAHCHDVRVQYLNAISISQIAGIGAFIFVVMPFYKPFFAKKKPFYLKRNRGLFKLL